MAFDLLSSLGGMGGSSQGAAQQQPAIQPTSGLTWADALRLGMQYGSKPGSSGPMVAGQIPGQQNPLQPLGPTQMMPTESERLKQRQGGDDSLGAILNALIAII